MTEQFEKENLLNVWLRIWLWNLLSWIKNAEKRQQYIENIFLSRENCLQSFKPKDICKYGNVSHIGVHPVLFEHSFEPTDVTRWGPSLGEQSEDKTFFPQKRNVFLEAMCNDPAINFSMAGQLIYCISLHIEKRGNSFFSKRKVFREAMRNDLGFAMTGQLIYYIPQQSGKKGELLVGQKVSLKQCITLLVLKVTLFFTSPLMLSGNDRPIGIDVTSLLGKIKSWLEKAKTAHIHVQYLRCPSCQI